MGNCFGSPQSGSKVSAKPEKTKEVSTIVKSGSSSVIKKLSLPKSILDIPLLDVNEYYTLGDELGRGLFGVTRKAVKKDTGELFACKSISKKKIRADNYKNTKREVDILRHLSKSELVAHLHEVYEDESAIHIVMELCTGGMLYDSITAKEKYTEAEAAGIMRAILKIVQYMHSVGVMHRDLKLENFLWATKEPNSILKAIDFGLSTFFKPGEKFSELVGSAYYVAPEVLKRNYGPEADIWSAGVIMYMLLCGVPPFWDVSEKGICEAVLKGEIDLTSDPWPLISDSAKDCLLHMLEENTRARWTPEKLLEHDWIREGGCAPTVRIACPILGRVKQFVAMNKIKRLALNVLVDSIEESEKNVIREKFDRLDSNHDGVVTFEEIREGLKKIEVVVEDAELQAAMEAADLNKRGGLTFTEYAATVMVKRLDHKRIRKAFEHLDKESKGYLEKDTLRQFLKVDSNPDLEDMIKDLDKNKDGRIDYDEFEEMMKDGMDITRGPMLSSESWIKNEYGCPAPQPTPATSSSDSSLASSGSSSTA